MNSMPTGASAPSCKDEDNSFRHCLATSVSSALGIEVSQALAEGMQSAQSVVLDCRL